MWGICGSLEVTRELLATGADSETLYGSTARGFHGKVIRELGTCLKGASLRVIGDTGNVGGEGVVALPLGLDGCAAEDAEPHDAVEGRGDYGVHDELRNGAALGNASGEDPGECRPRGTPSPVKDGPEGHDGDGPRAC